MTDKLRRAVKNACKAYKAADQDRWVSAYWAAQVVGKYDRGKTIGLSEEMGTSVDTIENLAHAYEMYNTLRFCMDGEFSNIVHLARKHPKVYMSHFIALYKARSTYGLTDKQLVSVLIDIVQARGQLSSRDVDTHIQSHYGVERPWFYYAARAQKEITKTLMCPDLPDGPRKVLSGIYEIVGDQA